jgi:hypothetical protein
MFDMADIVLFQEVPVEHPSLPGVGPIGGALDYVASSTLIPTNLLLRGTARPGKPHFIVVEAKKGTTVIEASSEAQLLAQILTLEHIDA